MHLPHNPLITWATLCGLMASAPNGCLGANLSKRSLISKPTMEGSHFPIRSHKIDPNNHSIFTSRVMNPVTVDTGSGKITCGGKEDMGSVAHKQSWTNSHGSGSTQMHQSFIHRQTWTHYRKNDLPQTLQGIKVGQLQALIDKQNGLEPSLEGTEPLLLEARPPSTSLHHSNLNQQSSQAEPRISEITDHHDEDSAGDHRVKQEKEKNISKSTTQSTQPTVEMPDEDEMEIVHDTPETQRKKHEPIVEEVVENPAKEAPASKPPQGTHNPNNDNEIIGHHEETKSKEISYELFKIRVRREYGFTTENIQAFDKWLQKTHQELYVNLKGDNYDFKLLVEHLLTWAYAAESLKMTGLFDHLLNNDEAVEHVMSVTRTIHLDDQLELLYPELTRTERKYIKSYAKSNGLEDEKLPEGYWTEATVTSLYTQWKESSPETPWFKFLKSFDKFHGYLKNLWGNLVKRFKKGET